jgi:hypothetical protein
LKLPPASSSSAPPPNLRLAVEYLSIERVQLNPKNPRRHKRAVIRKLAASIRTLGMNVPVRRQRRDQHRLQHSRVRMLGPAEATMRR